MAAVPRCRARRSLSVGLGGSDWICCHRSDVCHGSPRAGSHIRRGRVGARARPSPSVRPRGSHGRQHPARLAGLARAPARQRAALADRSSSWNPLTVSTVGRARLAGHQGRSRPRTTRPSADAIAAGMGRVDCTGVRKVSERSVPLATRTLSFPRHEPPTAEDGGNLCASRIFGETRVSGTWPKATNPASKTKRGFRNFTKVVVRPVFDMAASSTIEASPSAIVDVPGAPTVREPMRSTVDTITGRTTKVAPRPTDHRGPVRTNRSIRLRALLGSAAAAVVVAGALAVIPRRQRCRQHPGRRRRAVRPLLRHRHGGQPLSDSAYSTIASARVRHDDGRQRDEARRDRAQPRPVQLHRRRRDLQLGHPARHAGPRPHPGLARPAAGFWAEPQRQRPAAPR